MTFGKKPEKLISNCFCNSSLKEVESIFSTFKIERDSSVVPIVQWSAKGECLLCKHEEMEVTLNP